MARKLIHRRFLSGILIAISLAPACGFPQARQHSVAAVRVLVLPRDPPRSPIIDSIAAAIDARMTGASGFDDLWLLTWLDMDRGSLIGTRLPPSDSAIDADVFELTRQFDVALLQLRPGKAARGTVQPTLFFNPRTPIHWKPFTAATAAAATDSLAARINSDTTLTRLRAAARLCPGFARLSHDVDRSARFLGDTALLIRPVLQGERAVSYIGITIDTSGRPEPQSLVAPRLEGTTTRTDVLAAMKAWRFSPAKRGHCVVRQRMELGLTR